MPNHSQRELLDTFISEEGAYFEIIRDFDGVDLGTKILYLERAINQDCHTFLQSLDKIYNPSLNAESREAALEFIRAMKLINDLCFNNDVNYPPYGVRTALIHFFGAIGQVNPGTFRTITQQIIIARIAELRAGHDAEVLIQRGARINAEDEIIRQTGWRTEHVLPSNQLAAPVNSPLTNEQFQALTPETRLMIARAPLPEGGNLTLPNNSSIEVAVSIAANINTSRTIFLSSEISQDLATAVATHVPTGASLWLHPQTPEAIAIAIAANLTAGAILLIPYQTQQTIANAVASNLRASATFWLHNQTPLGVATSVAENLRADTILLLHSQTPEEVAITAAEHLRLGVTLLLHSETPQAIATAVAEHLREDATLLIHSETPQAVATAIASNLRAGVMLLLHNQTPQAVITAVAVSLRAGATLCLDYQTPQAVATAVAAILRPGATLWLHYHTSQEVATAVAASLRAGASLLLHHQTPQAVVIAVAANMREGATLLLSYQQRQFLRQNNEEIRVQNLDFLENENEEEVDENYSEGSQSFYLEYLSVLSTLGFVATLIAGIIIAALITTPVGLGIGSCIVAIGAAGAALNLFGLFNKSQNSSDSIEPVGADLSLF